MFLKLLLLISQILTPVQGERAELKGFVYEGDGGVIFLAEEPNLKSCCVGKKEQVELRGFPKGQLTSGAVSVAGVVGKEGERLVLLDASLVGDSGGIPHRTLILLGGAFLMIGGGLWWRKLFAEKRTA